MVCVFRLSSSSLIQCAELQGFVRPLLELLHGLKRGRFDRGERRVCSCLPVCVCFVLAVSGQVNMQDQLHCPSGQQQLHCPVPWPALMRKPLIGSGGSCVCFCVFDSGQNILYM